VKQFDSQMIAALFFSLIFSILGWINGLIITLTTKHNFTVVLHHYNVPTLIVITIKKGIFIDQ
jgi:hypothetical protein